MSVSSLGDLTITSGVDASGLSAGLDSAVSDVKNAADQMAGALGKVPPAAQEVGDALEGISPPAQKFSEAAQSIIDRQDKLEAKAESLKGALAELQQGYDAGTVSAETLARAQDQLDAVMAKVEGSTRSAGDAIEKAGESAGETGLNVESLVEVFGKLTGITLGAEALIEFAKAGLETYESLEKANIAITAVTGSSHLAHDAVESFIGIAQDDALSLPQVVTAGQRLLVTGTSASDMKDALKLAADTAAATGRSFEDVSNALYRMVESGNAGARQLVQLGISSQDLANAMGVSAGEVKKAFQELDPSERLDVIEQALAKFSGTAKLMADTVGGQWQILKTNTELAFAGVAEAVAPAANELLHFLNESVVPVVAGTVEGFQKLTGAIHTVDYTLGSIVNLAGEFVGLHDVMGKTSTVASDTSRSFDGLNHSLLPFEDNAKSLIPELGDVADGLGLVFTGLQQLVGIDIENLAGHINKIDVAMASAAKNATLYGAALKAKIDAEYSGVGGAKALEEAQAKANAEVTKAQAVLRVVTDDYNKAKASGAELTTVTGALTLAKNALTVALEKAHPALKTLKDTTDDSIISEATLTAKFNEDAAAVQGATAIWNSLFQKYTDGKISVDQLASAHSQLKGYIDAANVSAKSATAQAGELVLKHDEAVQAVKNEVQVYFELAQTYETESPIMVAQADKIAKGLDALGMSMSSLMPGPAAFATEVVKGASVIKTPLESTQTILAGIANAIDGVGAASAEMGNKTLSGAEAAAQGVRVLALGVDGANTSVANLNKNTQDAFNQMVINGKPVAAMFNSFTDAAGQSADAIKVLSAHMGQLKINAADALTPMQQMLNDAATSAQTLAQGMLTVDTNGVMAATNITGGFKSLDDAIKQAYSDLSAFGSEMDAVQSKSSRGGKGGGGGGFGATGGGFGDFRVGGSFGAGLNANDPMGAMLSELSLINQQTMVPNASALTIPMSGQQIADAWSQAVAAAGGITFTGSTRPAAAPSSGGSSAPSAPATSSTTSGTGNPLIDWLNSFTAAVSSASASAGSGTGSLPDWITQLDAALKTVATSTTQAAGTTLPDWVQQLSDVIQQATVGKNLVDMTTLGTAIQGVLANIPPLSTAITDLGTVTGNAGVALTAVSSSLTQSLTALTAAANPNPASFQAAAQQIQTSIPDFGPLAAGTLAGFSRTNPAAAPYVPQPLLNPIPNGIAVPNLANTMNSVTNSSTASSLSIGQLVVQAQDEQQLYNALTNFLQRRGIRF